MIRSITMKPCNNNTISIYNELVFFITRNDFKGFTNTFDLISQKPKKIKSKFSGKEKTRNYICPKNPAYLKAYSPKMYEKMIDASISKQSEKRRIDFNTVKKMICTYAIEIDCDSLRTELRASFSTIKYIKYILKYAAFRDLQIECFIRTIMKCDNLKITNLFMNLGLFDGVEKSHNSGEFKFNMFTNIYSSPHTVIAQECSLDMVMMFTATEERRKKYIGIIALIFNSFLYQGEESDSRKNLDSSPRTEAWTDHRSTHLHQSLQEWKNQFSQVAEEIRIRSEPAPEF